MKKVLVFLIVFGIVSSFTANYILSAEGSQTTSAKYGDINGDGNVDSTDYSLMKRYILKIIPEFPVSNGMIVADVNADTVVDSTDYSLLKRFILHIITEFPADKIPLATPTPVGNGIYEAEKARFTDAVVDTKHTGYSGTGYVDFNWSLGGNIEWDINVAKTGAYNLTFRYANASTNGNRPMEIRVNSNVVRISHDFNTTSEWTTWSETNVIVNLNQGNNVIRATGLTDDGGPNIDYLKVSESNGPVPTLSPVPTPIPTPTRTPIQEGKRKMENLGRGTVAIRNSSSEVFISWRILGLEYGADAKYNLYRGSTKIASNLNVSNYVDKTSVNEKYSVAAVINGVEQARSPEVGVTTYKHGTNSIPSLTVPLRVTPGYGLNYTWVGDLDGDGEMDFVIDKISWGPNDPILVEAYKRDGTFLWQYNCGPNSLNRDNISPGSSAISMGHGDGVTVYDMNSDGKAEVIIKTANGSKFADGKTVSDSDNSKQFISVLDGMTGKEIARAPVPNPRISSGPLNGHFGIAYLDGVNPSIVFSAKNRNPDKSFNMVITAWTLKNGTLVQNWSRGSAGSDGHNIRCLDVDGDGKDEVIPWGFAINEDGKTLYTLDIVHGDRFHIGDLDPNHPGLEGYAIQQRNPSGLAWALYDAKTGAILQKQMGGPDVDYARGIAFDVDPRYIGYELYTFSGGLYNVNGQRITTSIPNSYPNMRFWWDGDLLSEMLDNFKLVKWDYNNNWENRMYTFTDCTQTYRKTPGFYGDIIGDWREEAVYGSYDNSKLLIFTTGIPTSERIYTLLHNPGYRLSLTNKGYMQSTMADFYLGHGMKAPPVPDITY